MNEHIWNVFVQTGNVDVYLLLKQLEENEQHGVEEEQLSEIKTE